MKDVKIQQNIKSGLVTIQAWSSIQKVAQNILKQCSMIQTDLISGALKTMNEIWEAKRKRLENAVKISVLDLFEHMGSSQAFKLPLDPPKQILFVVAGDIRGIQSLTQTKEVIT